MKKLFLFILVSICSFKSFAQIRFISGYFINANGETINCFIKNVDWKNNPTSFTYRLSENATTETGNIKSVQEFCVPTVFKYKRFTVDIDRSSSQLNQLDTIGEPVFIKEELFLKVLVEGKATLYYYEEGGLSRFFYKTEKAVPEQLVFKNYLRSEDVISANNTFKQQLWDNLKCDKTSQADIETLQYAQNNLIRFFSRFNECQQSAYTNYMKNENKDLFNLTIRPGINSSSLSIQNSLFNPLTGQPGNYSTGNSDFGSKLNFRVGAEMEIVMPFNRNKWAIIAEPTFQYFKGESQFNDVKTTVNYKSIGIPIGIRHYFFLKDASAVFINASYKFDFALNSKITFASNYNSLDIKSPMGAVFGVGYRFKKKYAVEVQYAIKRNILQHYYFWASEFKTVSIVFGYNLF
jgi:hypothetical protein